MLLGSRSLLVVTVLVGSLAVACGSEGSGSDLPAGRFGAPLGASYHCVPAGSVTVKSAPLLQRPTALPEASCPGDTVPVVDGNAGNDDANGAAPDDAARPPAAGSATEPAGGDAPNASEPASSSTPSTTPMKGNNGVGNGVDPQPPGNPPVNDGPGTSPGDPGNKHH